MSSPRQILVSTNTWNVFSAKKLAIHSARTCLLTPVMSGATRSPRCRGYGLNTIYSKMHIRTSGGRLRSRNGGPLCLGFLAQASSYMLSRASLAVTLSISSKFFGDGVATALCRFDLLLGRAAFASVRMSFFAILLACAIHLSKFLGVAPPCVRRDLRMASGVLLDVAGYLKG